MPTYQASCHCGRVRFRFESEPITKGIRCNCSICVRKGAVMSDRYYGPEAFAVLEGEVGTYQFGDRDVVHCFCTTCGIFTFNLVASVPPDYEGPARPGDRRVNLGCVHDLDVYGLELRLVDGRAF